MVCRLFLMCRKNLLSHILKGNQVGESEDELGHIFSDLMLALALTTDSFVAGLSLGSQSIQIPLLSAAAASFVGTGCLIAALGLGGALAPVLPVQAARAVGFAVLFCLGLFKFFESSLKFFLRRQGGSRSLKFHAFGIGVLLQLYTDPQCADRDRSKRLSVGEALGLGIALSLDNFAAGVGAGLTCSSIWTAGSAALLLGTGMLMLGSRVARAAVGKFKKDLSLLGGALLLLLAFSRI